MKPAAWRLALTAVLFVGWLGYLAYLVHSRPYVPDPTWLGRLGYGRPIVLSRPQFLLSTLDVVARVDDLHQPVVTVTRVLYPKDNAPVRDGEQITVDNLDKCRALPSPVEKDKEPPLDWTGASEYILPLQPAGDNRQGHFEVAPTPPSPGYPPGRHGAGPPRLYPATGEMIDEYTKRIEGSKPK